MSKKPKNRFVCLALLASGGLFAAAAEPPSAILQLRAAAGPASGDAPTAPSPAGAASAAVATREERTTADMGDVLRQAEDFSRQGKTVLIAFDVDNTLLAANQALGSEPWSDAESDYLQPLDRPSTRSLFFLRLQTQFLDGIYNSVIKAIADEGKSHLVDDSIAGKIQDLQREPGVKMIVLTSRDGRISDSTSRALKENGINFSASKFGVDMPVFPVPGCPNPGSYRDGIFSTDGGAKGPMLVALLAAQKFTPDAVLYVDNKQPQVDGVFGALASVGADVIAYRYSRMDDQAKTYKERSDHPEARVQLKAWKESGRILSDAEAQSVIDRGPGRDPVPVSEANKLIYGKENPFAP
jgi:hypothetical protein